MPTTTDTLATLIKEQTRNDIKKEKEKEKQTWNPCRVIKRIHEKKKKKPKNVIRLLLFNQT